MLQKIRLVWDALFGHGELAGRFPRWLIGPVRFGYLVIQEFSRNRCQEKASALGFQTVFSLIPALVLALFFTRSLGGLENLGRDVTASILRQLGVGDINLPVPEPQAAAPPESMAPGSDAEAPAKPKPTVKLSDKIEEIINGVDLQLRSSPVNIVALGFLIVAAMSLALTMEHALNDIWGSTGRRGLLRRVALYWAVLTLGTLLVAVSMYVTRRIEAPVAAEDLIISTLGPLGAYYLLYQLVPSAPVHKTAAIAGAFVAAIAWQFAKWGFALYVRHVAYGTLYGSLGLIPVFLIWVWIGWVILLAGAQVAYTIQNLDRLVAEERRRRGAPFIQPGLVALGLVLHAGRAFLTGKGPVGDEEMAQSTGLPDHLWHRLVNLLVERGILVEAGPDGSRFIPGRPLESLRVEEIFAAVEGSLVARPDESWHPEQEQLQALAELLASARQRQLGQTSIADLLTATSPESAILKRRTPDAATAGSARS